MHPDTSLIDLYKLITFFTGTLMSFTFCGNTYHFIYVPSPERMLIISNTAVILFAIFLYLTIRLAVDNIERLAMDNAHVTFFSKLWDNSYIHNVKYCWYRNHTTDDNLVYYQVGQLCTTHHETLQYKEGK